MPKYVKNRKHTYADITYFGSEKDYKPIYDKKYKKKEKVEVIEYVS